MTDNRPIGVFDSGLGGLTTVRALEKLLPGEHIIYFGDTARIPYGTRSFETIIKYAREDFDFLMSFNIKAVVIACGTVSAVAFSSLKADIPIIDVVSPSARAAVKATKNNKIGLIATQASISSGVYNKKIHALNPDAELFTMACPLLVPLVEAGKINKTDLVTKLMIEEYLTPMKNEGIDTLILGCTHYPLLSDIIYDFLPVNLINSGEEAAKDAAERIDKASGENGKTEFFVSDSVQDFSRTASLLLGKNVENLVKKVDLERKIG